MAEPNPKMRADKAVQQLFPALTKRHVLEALEHGLVQLDQRRIKKGDSVEVSRLEVIPLKTHLERLRQGNNFLSLSILWESVDEWIVDKPAGMPSHPLSLFETETPTHWAYAQSQSISIEFPGVQPTITPHRLDAGTSGLLVVCKTHQAYEKWRERFQKKEVSKKYLAWCIGESSESCLDMSELIGHCPSDPRKMLVVSDEAPGREPIQLAQTKACLLMNQEGYSLWEVECTTGVTHQVRVHLANAGFPLVGDSLYDPHFSERERQLKHHCLRASELVWEEHRVVADTDQFRRGPFDPRSD